MSTFAIDKKSKLNKQNFIPLIKSSTFGDKYEPINGRSKINWTELSIVIELCGDELLHIDVIMFKKEPATIRDPDEYVQWLLIL